MYRKIGGHNYPWVYSGPIGAIITPQFHSITEDGWLPFASSLCGACYEVCPVKIDIPTVLVHLREQAVAAKRDRRERAAFGSAAWAFASPKHLARAQHLGAWLSAPFVRGGVIRKLPRPFDTWSRSRDLTPPARQSFRAWWRKERR